MIRVNVVVTSISGDRFLDIRKPVPPIQINTNLNLVGMEKQANNTLEVPFILTINYNPSVAQISLKGKAYATGDAGEIDKAYKDFEEKKPPPQVVLQAISNVAFVESVVLSRTLSVPPPIPLPQIPIEGKQAEKKQAERDYSA